MYLYNFISSGTITGNETRGSSLIGTGLAATVNNFAGLGEEGDNRTRVVIISTDNDVMGNEIITMPQEIFLEIERLFAMVLHQILYIQMTDRSSKELLKKQEESFSSKVSLVTLIV